MENGTDRRTIEVKRFELLTDPSIEIFAVEIGDDKSVWKETIPTEEAMRWFFRGLQAGANMFGGKHIFLPEVPHNPVLLKLKGPKL